MSLPGLLSVGQVAGEREIQRLLGGQLRTSLVGTSLVRWMPWWARPLPGVALALRPVLTRLGQTPVAVFTADWQLIWWNRSWAALLGDPSSVAAEDRSLVKWRFPVAADRGRVPAWPVVFENGEASDRAVVADLRCASARYPNDARLAGLITRTLNGNPRFAQLWRDGAVGAHAEDRKTIQHPDIGDITVDCDVLSDSDADLKIVIYTAVPGSEDETKLHLARVAGARPAR